MRKLPALLMVAALIVSACALQPATPAAPTQEPMATAAQPTEVAEDSMTATEQAAPLDEPIAAERPVIQTLPLTNVHTGETFTLADFAGKTVLVEPMASWCTNCRAQLRNVVQANAQLGEEYVFVGLSVGENISDGALAEYVDQQGFALIFAVATPDMLNELTRSFGRASITPPSTPHFIIRPDGSMTELFTGAKDSAALVALLTEASGA